MQNSILQTKEYGQITLKLRERMDEKGISRYNLAGRINTRFEVVNKWYNGKVEKIDLDVLARIFFVLNCRVEDLLVYETPKA